MKLNQTHQVLPAVAEEVKALVLLDHGDSDHPSGKSSRAGSLQTNITDLPYSLVILGTKVSEGYPSAVGFRILLRRIQQGGRPVGEADANYIVLSFKYESQGNSLTAHRASSTNKEDPNNTKGEFLSELADSRANTLTLRQASSTDKEDWENAEGEFLSQLAHSKNEFPKAQEDLHCLDLKFSTSEDHFECYYRKELSSLSQIDQIDEILACVSHSNRVRIFFPSDAVLLNYLQGAIAHDCCGFEIPPWNTQLHKDLLPVWSSTFQNHMVAGSSNILNVIRQTLREQKLVDGRSTKVDRRPDAKLFRDFIRKTYPSVRQEPQDCVYPLFLHVTGGRCVELPFGAYLVNRDNVYATINLLHELLNVPFQTTDVGIVTLYSAQVEIYRQALQVCHKRAPRKGYGNVWVATIEDWAHKEASFAIVDLVRTATSSGNLGCLSQIRRLEVAFSLHRDGIVVVGDINCSVNASGHVTSSKLDKVLEWFRDHGRIVRVGNGTPSDPTDLHGKPSESREHVPAAKASISTTVPPHRRYVGIPELESRNGQVEPKVKSWPLASTNVVDLGIETTGQKEKSTMTVLQPANPSGPTSDSCINRSAVVLSLPGMLSNNIKSQEDVKPRKVNVEHSPTQRATKTENMKPTQFLEPVSTNPKAQILQADGLSVNALAERQDRNVNDGLQGTGPQRTSVVQECAKRGEAVQVKGNQNCFSNGLTGQQHATPAEPHKTLFQAQYHARYQAIYALFDSLHQQLDNKENTQSSSIHTSGTIDTTLGPDSQLLRRLTQAYMSEDGETFTSLYIQMLLQAEHQRVQN